MIPHVIAHDDPDLPRLIEAALETGQTLIFPTDTIYGIGGNPWDEGVLDRVRSLKSRPPDRAFTLHLPTVDSIGRFAQVDDRVRLIVDRLLPGPYTFLLAASSSAPPSAVMDDVVGIRVPDHPLFRSVVAGLERPLFGTSVNQSGERPLSGIDEIIERFSGVDLIIVGPIGGDESTILDLTVDPPRLVRGVRPAGL